MTLEALRLLEVPLHRLKRTCGAVVFQATPSPPKVSSLARSLALGHHCVRLVESCQVEDYSKLADLLQVSQARVALLVQLTLLAPDIQEHLLTGAGRWPRISLMRAARLREWPLQRSDLGVAYHHPR